MSSRTTDDGRVVHNESQRLILADALCRTRHARKWKDIPLHCVMVSANSTEILYVASCLDCRQYVDNYYAAGVAFGRQQYKGRVINLLDEVMGTLNA